MNNAEGSDIVRGRLKYSNQLNEGDNIMLDKLESYAKEVAEAQREADLKLYQVSTDVRLSIIGKAIIMEMTEAPLVTETVKPNKA